MDKLIIKHKWKKAHAAIEDLRAYLYQFDNELPFEQGVKAMDADTLLSSAFRIYYILDQQDKQS